MSIVHPSTSLYYSSLKSNCVYEHDVSNPVISLSKNFFLLKELAPVTPSSPSIAKRSSRKNKSLCSGSQLYCDLTRSSVFKRILINNGNSISKSKRPSTFSRTEAVIKLQSFFRMVKVIRQYQDKVSEYTTGRSVLIIDTLARRGNWPRNIIPCDFLKKSRIKQELNSLYPLVEMYNKHETFKKQKVIIIKFLFLCLLRQNKDNLTAHDIKILLLDILCTDIPYTQIEGYHGIFSRAPYNGQVDFLQFYSWYDQNYNQMEKNVSRIELVYIFIIFIVFYR